MSKTDRSTTPGEDRWDLLPPFAAGRSGPPETWGGAGDRGTTCMGAGEGMGSEEDMVAREQEGFM